MKKMTAIKIRDFIFENYYRVVFSKENSYYLMKHQKKYRELFGTKLTEKIPDPRNAKEHFLTFIRKKKTKSVK